MRTSPTISFYELAEILRSVLETKLGYGVDSITVTSYDQPRLTIEFDSDQGGSAMIETIAFRHRTRP